MRRVIQCVRWGPVQALDGNERRLYFKISAANARLDHKKFAWYVSTTVCMYIYMCHYYYLYVMFCRS